MESDLERLSQKYETAESVFLDAVRSDSARVILAAAARAVANAASEFNTEAFTALHSGKGEAWMPLEDLVERTEVLAELWLDLAEAYEG